MTFSREKEKLLLFVQFIPHCLEFFIRLFLFCLWASIRNGGKGHNYLYVCLNVYMYVYLYVYLYLCLYFYLYVYVCLHTDLLSQPLSSALFVLPIAMIFLFLILGQLWSKPGPLHLNGGSVQSKKNCLYHIYFIPDHIILKLSR